MALAVDTVPAREDAGPLARGAGGVDTRLLPAAAALNGITAEWQALASEASEPNAFAEPWFVGTSLETLGGGDLRLAEVRRHGELIGVSVLERARGYARMPVAHACNWRHHHLFLGTPLVRAGQEEAFWSGLLAALDRDAEAGNLLHWRGLAEGGPVHRGLVAACQAEGRSCDVVHRGARAMLSTTLDPAAYYSRTVRPKKRKEIRRLRTRLAELGTIGTRRLGNGAEIESWCDAFLRLERSGWKGRAGTALAARPETETFFRAAVAGAWAAGKLEFLRLDLDGRPIAMLVNFLASPGSFSFKTAYDEDYSRFSPGVLIQLENLDIVRRPDIDWMDSCATENHPMIDRLWSNRRSIVRVTVSLAGAKRAVVHASCRALERASSAWRAGSGRKRA